MAKKRNTLLEDDDDNDNKPSTESEVTPLKKRKKKQEDEEEESESEDDDNRVASKAKPAITKPTPRAIVTLDVPRKLTKKDQKSLEGWHGKNRGLELDKFFGRQVGEARKQHGTSNVFLGSETHALVIGIPCPALAFQYVIAQDCFPLGLVLQIVAKHGVGKSGLLAEIGRWFDLAGGGMVLCENETKFNPFWYQSILGEKVYNRMLMHRCNSVEDWQRHLTGAIKLMKRDMDGTKEKPGPGRIFPVLFGVDSIMGKMSEEIQEKILGKVGKKGKQSSSGDGFAQSRSYPVEAGSITKYMRTVPQMIDKWPFALVLINHLRIKKDDMGNEERNKTGGDQIGFQESFELELKRVGGPSNSIACATYEGLPLQLMCHKNSFGPTNRKAQIRLLWWHEPDKFGTPVQKTVWDWDWATVHLLHSLMGPKGPTYLKSRLKDIGFHIDCPSVSDVDNSAWSKSLGMTKDDAVSWSELGALIREDADLMIKLQDALCIVRRPILAGDYTSQLETAALESP